TYFNPYVTPELASSIPWRRAELGGSNGHGNARSVAILQSVLSCGGETRGKRLISQVACERAIQKEGSGIDLAFGVPVTFGLGYMVDSPLLASEYGTRLDGHRVACWGGSGGSFVMNDLDRHMTVAFVMNKHVEAGGWDSRSVNVISAAYDCLAVAQ